MLDIQPFVNPKGINASRIPDASHSLYSLLSPPRFCTLTPRYTSVLGGGARQRKAEDQGRSYIRSVSANPRGHFQSKYNNRLVEVARFLVHFEGYPSACDISNGSPSRPYPTELIIVTNHSRSIDESFHRNFPRGFFLPRYRINDSEFLATFFLRSSFSFFRFPIFSSRSVIGYVETKALFYNEVRDGTHRQSVRTEQESLGSAFRCFCHSIRL